MARLPAAGPDSEPYKLGESPSHLLHRAEQLASDRFAQLVGASITLRQFAVLAAIKEKPGLSQSELVRITGVDRSTLADMMTRMERRGWITRTSAPLDGRALSVHLALDGATMLKATTQAARAADATVLDLLARTKRRTFLNILIKVTKLADEAAEKAEREAKRRAKREKRAKKEQAKKEQARQVTRSKRETAKKERA
jgi:DNA-binding MarR family transcriptional regulator